MSNQQPSESSATPTSDTPTSDTAPSSEPLFQTPSGPAAAPPSAARGCSTVFLGFGVVIFAISIVYAVQQDNKSRECKQQCSAQMADAFWATKYGFDEADLCIQHCQLAEGYCPSPLPNKPKYQGCLSTAFEILGMESHSGFCNCGRKYKYTRGFADKIEMELVP